MQRARPALPGRARLPLEMMRLLLRLFGPVVAVALCTLDGLSSNGTLVIPEGATTITDSAMEGCDALVVVTEWSEFKELDLVKARDAMTAPLLFDGRNLFDPEKLEQLGFTYKSIGR